MFYCRDCGHWMKIIFTPEHAGAEGFMVASMVGYKYEQRLAKVHVVVILIQIYMIVNVGKTPTNKILNKLIFLLRQLLVIFIQKWLYILISKSNIMGNTI